MPPLPAKVVPRVETKSTPQFWGSASQQSALWRSTDLSVFAPYPHPKWRLDQK